MIGCVLYFVGEYDQKTNQFTAVFGHYFII